MYQEAVLLQTRGEELSTWLQVSFEVVTRRLAYFSPSGISCLRSVDESCCGEDKGNGWSQELVYVHRCCKGDHTQWFNNVFDPSLAHARP